MNSPASPRRWSLRTRLLVSSVTLIAVVCAIVGVVTAMSLRIYLIDKLDSGLHDSAFRVSHTHFPGGPPSGCGLNGDQSEAAPDPLASICGPGQAPGTLGAVLAPSGPATYGMLIRNASPLTPQLGTVPLTPAQLAALSSLPHDNGIHTLTLPGLGDYHLTSTVISGTHFQVAVGVPVAPVTDTVDHLAVVIICVTAAGLAAAGLAGGAMIRYALIPLRRVAATAARVSELPLARGEVSLRERVPEADTDRRTEVGQVGSALNRLLGHVESALEARQASETRVRQFVADASHELRTPLASIRGYAELVRRGPEEQGPGTRHALGRIESEAGRMTTLVEDLLLLARLDAGRPLSYETADLSPLVIDTVSDARAAGPDHSWRVDLPDDPALVRADSARLHQVLANLLANARTHTPPGTTVTARVTPGDDAVTLDVEDTGPGIPADLLPHVFERFARGDHSRARANGATPGGSSGLGLAIVHAVVTAHGGTITADSAPGRTIFRLTLPAV